MAHPELGKVVSYTTTNEWEALDLTRLDYTDNGVSKMIMNVHSWVLERTQTLQAINSLVLQSEEDYDRGGKIIIGRLFTSLMWELTCIFKPMTETIGQKIKGEAVNATFTLIPYVALSNKKLYSLKFESNHNVEEALYRVRNCLTAFETEVLDLKKFAKRLFGLQLLDTFTPGTDIPIQRPTELLFELLCRNARDRVLRDYEKNEPEFVEKCISIYKTLTRKQDVLDEHHEDGKEAYQVVMRDIAREVAERFIPWQEMILQPVSEGLENLVSLFRPRTLIFCSVCGISGATHSALQTCCVVNKFMKRLWSKRQPEGWLSAAHDTQYEVHRERCKSNTTCENPEDRLITQLSMKLHAAQPYDELLMARPACLTCRVVWDYTNFEGCTNSVEHNPSRQCAECTAAHRCKCVDYLWTGVYPYNLEADGWETELLGRLFYLHGRPEEDKCWDLV